MHKCKKKDAENGRGCLLVFMNKFILKGITVELEEFPRSKFIPEPHIGFEHSFPFCIVDDGALHVALVVEGNSFFWPARSRFGFFFFHFLHMSF